jgi:hypothetical protein
MKRLEALFLILALMAIVLVSLSLSSGAPASAIQSAPAPLDDALAWQTFRDVIIGSYPKNPAFLGWATKDDVGL